MADAVATDITTFLAQQEKKELLRFLTAGNVDDGKSTLIGRLLYDTQLIYEDQLAAVRRDSERLGTTGGEIDLALLMDGLKAEREQGITIDVAYRYFSTSKRKFIIADCPGHEQYTRNMATGASNCDLAIILIDARYGVQQQTRRHSFIVSLLGIKHVVVAINKMDLVGWSEEVFESIKRDYVEFATRLEMNDLRVVPISALKGDNIVEPGTHAPWYQGETLLHLLETVHIASDRNLIDLRFPVQYVNRPNLDFRGFSGTVASGVIREGEDVMVLPSKQRSRVRSIVTYDGAVPEAFPPMAVTVVLDDEIDVSRGSLIVHPHNVPRVDRTFEAMLVWMGEEPMAPGRPYLVKQGTNLVTGTVSRLRYRVDVNTLRREQAEGLAMNEVGRCTVTLSRPVAVDPYRQNRTMGAFIVVDRLTNRTVGAGMVLDRRVSEDAAPSAWDGDTREAALAAAPTAVSPAERVERFGQTPVTVLITGLEAAGKTTLAFGLERRLFDDGRAAVVLDGRQLRQTVSRDLGFTAADRSENLRRAADVARLLNDAGLIAICALMAPDAAIRARARGAVGADRFLVVHVSTPIAVCRTRDTQGIYARADAGELGDFPGVSAPYEPPTDADLVLDMSALAVEDGVDRVVRLLQERGALR